VALNPIQAAIEAIKARAIAASGGTPAAAPEAAPEGPPVGPPPGGTPAPKTPESYKSPPDLMAMYTQLTQKAQMADAFRRGGMMIGAGLSPYQSTREAMLAKVGGAGGGASGLDMTDIINLQKMQQGEADAAARKAQLPALAKQFGLSDVTVQYLNLTDALDEVIAAASKPENQIIQAADGSQLLVDKRDGSLIKNLSPAKVRDTEYRVNSDGTRTVVYTDTKEPVEGREALGADPATQKTLLDVQQGPKELALREAQLAQAEEAAKRAEAEGRRADATAIREQAKADQETEKIARRNRALPAIVKALDLDQTVVDYLDATDQLDEFLKEAYKPDNEVVTDETNGSKRLISKKDGRTILNLTAGKKRETTLHKLPSGGEVLIYTDDNTRVSDGKQILETAAPDPLAKEHQLLEEINAGRKARGQDPMTMDRAVKLGILGGISVNVGTGAGGGKTPEGYEPMVDEKSGELLRDDNGEIRLRRIGGPGGPAAAAEAAGAADLAKTEATTANTLQDTIDKKAKALSESDAAAKAKLTADEVRIADRTKYRALDSEINDALANLKEHEGSWIGTTGWGAALNWWPGRNPSKTLADNLAAITSNIGIKTVTDMRKASPTGGALGNVTDADVAMLKRIYGSMDQWGDDRELAKRLRRFKVAQHLVVDGVQDKEHVPRTKDNPLQMRAPTEAEVDAAIADAEKSEGEAAGMYKGLRVEEIPDGEE